MTLAEELRDVAERLARQAGEMALAGRKSGLREVRTKSTLTDMVTEYDRASEVMVVEGLRTLRPMDSIVGEEGTAYRGTSDITWYVDPIDGTTNFLYDIPLWAVSIGAKDSQSAIACAVFVAGTREMFTAVRGAGAFLNGSPIACNASAELHTALVGTGFSYSPQARTVQAERVAKMVHRVRDIRRFGAAAVDLCYVACGRLDAYFEENLFEWDIAAGDLIAREAGCRTGDFAGNPVRPAQTLAAPPLLFEPLRLLIAESSAADQP